jgi:hypothetical protein
MAKKLTENSVDAGITMDDVAGIEGVTGDGVRFAVQYYTDGKMSKDELILRLTALGEDPAVDIETIITLAKG